MLRLIIVIGRDAAVSGGVQHPANIPATTTASLHNLFIFPS
jgi:hypothetical protein